MPSVLIVYASTHGHTAKIAARIARALEGRGAGARLCDVASAAELATPDFDAVLVGASVHNGHHQRDMVAWAEGHATALSMMPSAFFSVCLTAADDTDEARQATRNYLDNFEDQTGWTPRMKVSFAGALKYREYDFPTRLVMRLLMSRGQHPTDVTRDYDYTDWEAVDRFADDLSRMVADAVPATS